MRAVWIPIVFLLATGCREPESVPPGLETITPTPAEEHASTPPETTATGATDDPPTPTESYQPPDGPPADLAARHFEERRFREKIDFRLSDNRRLYVFEATPDEENPHFVVLVGRVDNRIWAERVHYEHELAQVMLRDDDFGPGLVELDIRSLRPPEAESPPRRDRPSRPTRSFPTEETLLFVLDARRGLEQVHRTVTSDNGVSSASLRWDAQRRTLTTTVQRRNSPGRERCLRPEPYDIVHTWRAGHFAETHRDQPSPPCGRRSSKGGPAVPPTLDD